MLLKASIDELHSESVIYESLHLIEDFSNYNDWVFDHFESYLSGVLLEAGSGIGTFAGRYARPGVERVILADRAPAMLEWLGARFSGNKFYEICPWDITRPFGRGEVADRVIAWNVLEHVRDDQSALKNMSRALKPGGLVLVMVPALPCIYGTLDQAHGHYRRYTRASLESLGRACGLQTEACYYFNFFGILTWTLGGKLLRQKAFHSSACRRLDSWVPWFRRWERRAVLPFGQSLVYIARSC